MLTLSAHSAYKQTPFPPKWASAGEGVTYIAATSRLPFKDIFPSVCLLCHLTLIKYHCNTNGKEKLKTKIMNEMILKARLYVIPPVQKTVGLQNVSTAEDE